MANDVYKLDLIRFRIIEVASKPKVTENFVSLNAENNELPIEGCFNYEVYNKGTESVFINGREILPGQGYVPPKYNDIPFANNIPITWDRTIQHNPLSPTSVQSAPPQHR